MINKQKKVFWIVLVALMVVGIGILLFFYFTGEEKAEMSIAKSASESSLPSAHTANNRNLNRFILRQVSSDDKTVTAQLSVGGKVSLCRYNMALQFDSTCLRLKDYDADLSAYAPVVNPEKNEDGTIGPMDNNGTINLVWAHTDNLTKPGDIITVVFEKTEAFADSTSLFLNVKEIGTFRNNMVEDTDYNAEGLFLK